MEKTSRTLKPCLDYFPVELLSIILSRVSPVRSLVQWRCVSKTWKALIDDPVFARQHLDHWNSICDESRLFVFQSRNNTMVNECVLRSAKSLSIVENLAVVSSYLPGLSNTLPPIANDDGEIVHWDCCSTVDGMVMLANAVTCPFGLALWNPSIRKARRVPPCPQITSRNHAQHFGFGFDPSSQDYKHLVLVYSGVKKAMVMQFYAIYSVGSNSWKTIECRDQYFTGGLRCCGEFMATCVGGVMYHEFNVSFDLSTETFSLVTYPYVGSTFPQAKLTTAHCGRSLSMVQFTALNGYVWVMQEGGVWTQRYKFRLVDPKTNVRLYDNPPRILHLTTSDEVLMDWSHMVFTCYSIQTGDQKVLLEDRLSLQFVQPYKESLLLLN